MTARLERDVYRRAPGVRTRGAQRQDFRMGLARPHMPALAQHSVVPSHHAADARIRIGGVQAAGGEAQCARHVRLVSRLDPPWTTDWITPEGRDKLEAYGVAPPLAADSTTACPRCGSPATEEISAFGSTPCKALWRCTACGEPFDKFKCH